MVTALRISPHLVVALAATGCKPVAAPATRDADVPAPVSAASFDAGPVSSAAEYLASPQYAAADSKRGELLALACVACHTLRAGEPSNVGPNLHAVFGRPAASLSGFAYSDALRATGLTWTPRALDAWLAEPGKFVPGTTMAFTGYRDAGDRRDLIAYLLRITQ